MLDGQKKLHKNDEIARPGTRQPRKTRKSVTHGGLEMIVRKLKTATSSKPAGYTAT